MTSPPWQSKLLSGRRSRPRSTLILVATLESSLVTVLTTERGSAQPAPAPEISPAAPPRGLDALQDLEDKPLEELWNHVHTLRESWSERTGPHLEGLAHASALFDLTPKARFAAAALVILTRREDRLRDMALAALVKFAHEGTSRELQAAAIGVLGTVREAERVIPVLRKLLDEAAAHSNSSLQAACCLALWQLDNTTSRHPLLKILDADEFSTRAEAALALAQTGFLDSRVLEVLRQLRAEPGRRGAQARLLYESSAGRGAPAANGFRSRQELEEEVARLRREAAALSRPLQTPAPSTRPDMLADVIDLVRREYVEPKRVEPQSLYLEAFQALVAKLDHALFLSPQELEHRRSRSLGQHLGVGAQFVKPDRDSPLVVVRPYFSRATAAKPVAERLRTGDRVVAVNGVPTRGKSPEEIVTLFAGKEAGSSVYLEVRRWGEDQPRTIEAAYSRVELPTVLSESYPGGIGYVRLLTFGARTAADFRASLDELKGSSGDLKGLVLDLRDNLGGRLDQAVEVVDALVADGVLPIVSETRPDGRSGQAYLPNPDQDLACPIVVLVNRWTASSAEVVAGALQDLRRAAVVGQPTYGKGVVQKRFPAPAGSEAIFGGAARVQLPTHYLVLPSGRRFHTERDSKGRPLLGSEGGIRPDIEVDPVEEEFEGWQIEELRRVQFSEEIDAYVRGHFAEIRSAWKEGDLWDPAYYAGFDVLYDKLRSSLGISLMKQQVRMALRSVLRHHLEEELGREIASDPREDRQLQQAIRTLAAAMQVKLDEVPELNRWLGEAKEESK
jgi:carboxyl-terminal processing protease